MHFEYILEVESFWKHKGVALLIKCFSWNNFKTHQKSDDLWMYNAFSKQFQNVWRVCLNCPLYSLLDNINKYSCNNPIISNEWLVFNVNPIISLSFLVEVIEIKQYTFNQGNNKIQVGLTLLSSGISWFWIYFTVYTTSTLGVFIFTYS
jgi:hypothetical protein